MGVNWPFCRQCSQKALIYKLAVMKLSDRDGVRCPGWKEGKKDDSNFSPKKGCRCLAKPGVIAAQE